MPLLRHIAALRPSTRKHLFYSRIFSALSPRRSLCFTRGFLREKVFSAAQFSPSKNLSVYWIGANHHQEPRDEFQLIQSREKEGGRREPVDSDRMMASLDASPHVQKT